jgi:hypothetical protein
MRSALNLSLSILIACLVVILAAVAPAKDNAPPLITDAGRDNLGIFVLDGSGVHDAGQLHLHTGNWGAFGSYPGTSFPISQFPSGEWPAGSGVEHLFISGLWVGARKGCVDGSTVPCVSTAAFDMEFRPTEDPIDRFYESYEGAPGGNRLPSPYADDDGDGLTDEDWLDGRDNDGDGAIDEDYAAISQQMFSSWFTDDQESATNVYLEHNPMHITVRQESYQWTDERFDDFVGITFTITNTGTDCLREVYLGFFMDGDVGNRLTPFYWQDDAAGSWRGIRCTELGPAYVSMGYMYDADGDGGRATSYFGAMILGHRTDPTAETSPYRVGMSSFQIFSGNQPYENGGDPTNDFQRYEIMAMQTIDRDQSGASDYRILISTGPFSWLNPGQSLVFHVGLVAGDGLEGLLDNAARCQRLFDGLWFDVDGDPMTGIDRRETPLPGPVSGVVIDSCRVEYSEPASWPRGVTRWLNTDCRREDEFKAFCGYSEADSLLFRTGVAGLETQVNWIYERPQDEFAAIDIRPWSCPNPFMAKLVNSPRCFRWWMWGILPVAILGTEDFDVHEVDISTVRLEGVRPLCRWRGRYRDVSRPVPDRTGCECTTEGPDGYTDLVLWFSNQKIARALRDGGPAVPGETRELTLTGELRDGTAFEAADCVVFVGRSCKPVIPLDGEAATALGGEPALLPASPNPFNPVTRLSYYLPEQQHVQLTVYDVSGRQVEVLEDGVRPAGEHSVEWNARGLASGVYFYRLVAGDFVQTKKMVLMR